MVIQENFSFPNEQQTSAIKNESKIYSAAGEGRIPFISAKDIARVAFEVLTGKEIKLVESILIGPNYLSHQEVWSHCHTFVILDLLVSNIS